MTARHSFTAVLLLGLPHCTGAPAQQAPSLMRTTLTVWGSEAVLRALTVDHAHLTSTVSGGATFESDDSITWASTFAGRLTKGGEPVFSLKPFVCPGSARALAVIAEEGIVTEHLKVEIVDGIGWATGSYGSPAPGHHFFPRCEWRSPIGVSGGEETKLDGPSRCDEASRARSHVEVRDGAGQVISEPEFCSALRYAFKNGVVALSLSRAAESPGQRAFALNLSHCLSASDTVPVTIEGTTMATAWCVDTYEHDETAHLGLGLHEEGTQTTPISGTWVVRAMATPRGSVHVSDLDMAFKDQAGVTYRVVGHVEVPEVLY